MTSRWELCVKTAERMMDEPQGSRSVWLTARSLYDSDVPTDDPELR